MQWVHITVTNVFGMLLKYQSRVNFGTPGNSWAPGNQSRTGRMGLKDRCEGKLFGRSETTSSLARAYGINTHLFFFAEAAKSKTCQKLQNMNQTWLAITHS